MKTYTLCLHDLRVVARLGIFREEKDTPQTILLSLDILVDQQQCDFHRDDGVPSYATIAANIRQLCIEEHTDLCENLAYRIATMCFEDNRILAIEVKVLKPQAIADARAGVRMNIARDEIAG